MPSDKPVKLPPIAQPTSMDQTFGWAVNIQLLDHLSKIITYPAHVMAIEQIILEYERLRSGEVKLAPVVHPDQQKLNLPNPNTGD